MESDAPTPESYIQSLPEDRQTAMAAVRDIIKSNLPDGYEECVDFGMISYVIPLSRDPKTYNGHPLMYAALASQKNYMAVYLLGVYGNTKTAEAFRATFAKEGKELDMGKSCVRFKRLEDLSLNAIATVIASCSVEDYIKHYETTRPPK